MGKVQALLNDLKLNKSELEELKREVEKRLKGIKPVYIKEVRKRCGKPGCTCDYGDINEYGHGPYLYALWAEGKTQKQKSLGPKFDWEQIKVIYNEPGPEWYQFAVSEKQYEKMTQEQQWGTYKRDLSTREFEAFYGCPIGEDKLNRPREVRYDQKLYDKAMQAWAERQEVSTSEFAHRGVGTLKGVLTLRRLIEQGYYLA